MGLKYINNITENTNVNKVDIQLNFENVKYLKPSLTQNQPWPMPSFFGGLMSNTCKFGLSWFKGKIEFYKTRMISCVLIFTNEIHF